jgi:hypothetical protein
VRRSATKSVRTWEIWSPEDVSAIRKRLADTVAAHDHAVGMVPVDLVAAYDAMEAAGALMRQWEASGQWLHGGNTGCDGTLS